MKSQRPAFVASARKLPKDCLGGAIFGCKNTTMQECLTKQLFGLPSSHFSFVANISVGLPLFLFDYSNRKMHGIYEAASNGQMNIDPYAWTDGGNQRTAFPAQVRIYVKTPCVPLCEDQFRKVIKGNYYHHNHFYFDLDHEQARALMSLFVPLPVPAEVTKVLPTTKVKPVLEPVLHWKAKNNQQHDYYSPHDLKETQKSAENKDNIELFSPSSNDLKVEEVKEQKLNLGLCDADDQNSLSAIDANLDKVSATHDSVFENEEVGMPKKLDKLCLYDKYPQLTSSSTLVINDSSIICISQDVQKEALPIEEFSENKVEEKATMSQLHQIAQLVEIVEQLTKKTTRLEIQQATSCQEIERLHHVVNESGRKIEELRNKVQELGSKHPSNRFLEDEKVIYLIGGFDGSTCLSAVDTFSPSRDYLWSCNPISFPRSYTSAATLEENIFVFGGGDGTGTVWYDTVECYNRIKKEWTECPKLNRAKGSHGAATLRDKIYVIGGGDGVECLSDVEMFDPTLGRWIRPPPLSKKRFAPSVLELNGAIYAVGGYDGTCYLMSAERYDPREAYWTRLPSMNTPRGCHSMAVLNQKIYAMGGYNGEAMVSSTEIFDPRLSCWMPGEPMGSVRGYGAAGVLDDVMYAIGGLGVEDTCTTVESFKEGIGWSSCNFKSTKTRCFFSAIVV